VDEAIHKTEVLIQALDWIRQFRNRLVVIKLGGSALEDPATVRSLLKDVVSMEIVGMKPILIHGGGLRVRPAGPVRNAGARRPA